MLLLRLKEYADTRLGYRPANYVTKPVRYIIQIDQDGRLLRPEPVDASDGSKGRAGRGVPMEVPEIVRGVDIKPFVLADKAEFVLGRVPQKSTKPAARTQAEHRSFIDIVERCAAVTHEPAVEAVRRFYAEGSIANVDLRDDFDGTATFTFEVTIGQNAVRPVGLPAVHAFWAAEHDPAARDAEVMQCVVCGVEGPVLRTHPKIKGVPNSNAAGANIISANADAFYSYGLEQSLIAPTCAACAERFTRATNELLSGPAGSLRVSDAAAFIFWTREDVGFSLSTYLSDPQPEDVAALLRSAHEGRRTPEIDDTAFYAAVLSGNNARIAVRDWIDTTVGTVKDNLAVWFRRQAIVGRSGEAPAPLKLIALAGATVRELRDIAPATPRLLFEAALSGNPLPLMLLAQATRRNRAEQDVTVPRAALIKLVLCGQDPTLEETMVQLDLDTTNPAYRCGRLLAVLEAIQREALPGVNATIVDRFFGAASSAPASVFSRLVRGAQPHLSKLERDKRGAYLALQARMEEVLSGLADFPRVLMLEDQGRFALGYYHQRARDRAQRRDAAERRRARQDSDTTDMITDEGEN